MKVKEQQNVLVVVYSVKDYRALLLSSSPSLPQPTPPLLASFALLGESDGNGLLLAPLAARSGRHLGLGPWLALEPTTLA